MSHNACEGSVVEKSKKVLIDNHPGRNSQTYVIAREIGTDLELIHQPAVGVIGNKGDSQCYLGVQGKVEVIQECLRQKIRTGEDQLRRRLFCPRIVVIQELF